MEPEVPAALMSAAQGLHAAGGRTTGLLPADRKVDATGLAGALGRALAELTGGPVAVTGPWSAGPAEGGTEPYRREAELDGVILLGIPPAPSAEAAAAALGRAVDAAAPLFQHLLADLTGLSPLLASQVPAVGRILIVARAGRTGERALRRLYRTISEQRRCGVLLVE